MLGGHVYYGLGNGTFVDAADKPAGAVLCVDAGSGKKVWRYDVADGVLDRPTVAPERVFFGARDGHCYCVDRNSGSLVWKHMLDSPVVASPMLAFCSHCGAPTSLYTVASAGKISCLDPRDGRTLWSFDVARHSNSKPQLFATPAVVVSWMAGGERRHIYVGAGLDNVVSRAAVLYCLEDTVNDSHPVDQPDGAASP